MFPKGSGRGVLCDGPCASEHDEVFAVEVGVAPTGTNALVVNECDEIVTVTPLTRPVIATVCYGCLKRLMPQHLPAPAAA